MTTTIYPVTVDKTRENSFKRELKELFDKYGIVMEVNLNCGYGWGEYSSSVSFYSCKYIDRGDHTVNESIDITIQEGPVDFS